MTTPGTLPPNHAPDTTAAQHRETARRALEEACSGRDLAGIEQVYGARFVDHVNRWPRAIATGSARTLPRRSAARLPQESRRGSRRAPRTYAGINTKIVEFTQHKDQMTSTDRSDTEPSGRRVPFVSTPEPAPDLSVRAMSGAPTVVFIRP